MIEKEEYIKALAIVQQHHKELGVRELVLKIEAPEGKIEYLNRYSSTDLPDDLGRWARLAVYKNIRIAWISRLEVKGAVVFSVSLHFPTMQNDTANQHKSFFSFDDAKGFVKERWEWFLNTVNN